MKILYARRWNQKGSWNRSLEWPWTPLPGREYCSAGGLPYRRARLLPRQTEHYTMMAPKAVQGARDVQLWPSCHAQLHQSLQGSRAAAYSFVRLSYGGYDSGGISNQLWSVWKAVEGSLLGGCSQKLRVLQSVFNIVLLSTSSDTRSHLYCYLLAILWKTSVCK